MGATEQLDTVETFPAASNKEETFVNIGTVRRVRVEGCLQVICSHGRSQETSV